MGFYEYFSLSKTLSFCVFHKKDNPKSVIKGTGGSRNAKN